MTKFEAETYKEYIGYNGEKITLKQWIANQVNSSWIYSMHWNDLTWVDQAEKDCVSRIASVKEDLDSLYNALSKIKEIDV